MSGPSGLLATCLRNVAEVVPVAELTAPWHTKYSIVVRNLNC